MIYGPAIPVVIEEVPQVRLQAGPGLVQVPQVAGHATPALLAVDGDDGVSVHTCSPQRHHQHKAGLTAATAGRIQQARLN